MGAVPVNAVVSPWFVRTRPAALGSAYNGASFAGLIFSPLWVFSIALMGFPLAASAIGIVTVAVVIVLSWRFFACTPQQMGVEPDGDMPGRPAFALTSPHARPLPGRALWRDCGFITLAGASALSLFALFQSDAIVHRSRAAAAIPAPADVLGFAPGDDRKLASWAKVVEYFEKLAGSSDRIKFEEIGKSTMGAPFVYATISAPENLKRLDEFKEIQRQLADPRILADGIADYDTRNRLQAENSKSHCAIATN